MPKTVQKLSIIKNTAENKKLKPDINRCLKNFPIENLEKTKKNHLINNCQLLRFYEMIDIGIIIINEQQQIIDANPSALNLLNLKQNHILNKIKYRDLKLSFIHEDGTHYPMDSHPAVLAITNMKEYSDIIMGISKDANTNHTWIKVNALSQSSNNNKSSYTIVTFEDITHYKSTQETLKLTNTNLEIKRASLENKNIVLDGILKQVEKEKQAIALQIQTTIDKIAMPLLDSLDERLTQPDKQYINILKSVLKDIATPFLKKEDLLSYKLTPRELEILSFIKNGLRSKDIAKLLSITEGTIRQQRKSIRKKLGIAHRPVNLISYLQNN